MYLYTTAPAAPSAAPKVRVSSTADTVKVKIKVRTTLFLRHTQYPLCAWL